MNTEDLSRVRKSVSTEVLFCVRKSVDTEDLSRVQQSVDAEDLSHVRQSVNTKDLSHVRQSVNTEDLSRVRQSVSTEVLFCVRNQWTLRTYPESNSNEKVYDIHLEVIKTKNALVISLIEYCIENPLEIISFAVKSKKIDLYACTVWICDWYTRQTTSAVTLDFGVEASLWRLLHIQSEIGIGSVRNYKGTPHPR